MENSVKISHVYHYMNIHFCKLHLQNYSEWDITISLSFFSVMIPSRNRCGWKSFTKSWLPLCAMYLLWISEIKELTHCAKQSIGRTILIPMMNNWELDASWNIVLPRIRSYCNIQYINSCQYLLEGNAVDNPDPLNKASGYAEYHLLVILSSSHLL